MYLGQIRIKCISVSVSFQNGHAKSNCVVLVANHSLCVFNGETPCLILRERDTDRQTDRQTDRESCTIFIIYFLYFIVIKQTAVAYSYRKDILCKGGMQLPCTDPIYSMLNTSQLGYDILIVF